MSDFTKSKCKSCLGIGKSGRGIFVFRIHTYDLDVSFALQLS